MSTLRTKSADEQAIELTAPRKYHQLLRLPATASHDELKVTYGIAGKAEGDDVPTILFCGGMFGSRWQAVFQNHLAEQEGVRILYIDRYHLPCSLISSVYLHIITDLALAGRLQSR